MLSNAFIRTRFFLIKVVNIMKARKKLIIWDFDGVIADTEVLWIKVRMDMLNEKFGFGWDVQQANYKIGGISDKTKTIMLKDMGYEIEDHFWEEALRRDYEVMNKGFSMTPGVEKIFNNKNIKQCIATGGIWSKTVDKLKICGAGKYISQDKVFVADMVKHGKPEPDLFLLAAEKMEEKPQDCVVIEDSIAGLTAGLRAGMETIAFVGSAMNNNPEYIAKVKELGIKHIFTQMSEIETFLFS